MKKKYQKFKFFSCSKSSKKNKLLKKYLFILLVIINNNFAQTPGGVSANLKAWYKASEGVTGTTTVTGWSDIVNGYNTLQATIGEQPTLNLGASTNMNFNPYLIFDGINDHLEYKGGAFYEYN